MASVENIVREVEVFFANYNDAFNREDHPAFFRCFAYPNAFLAGAMGMMVSNTPQELERPHLHAMKSFHERGWARTAVDRLEVWPLADQMAMIVADVTRYKKDDSVLERGRYCYTLRKEDADWKILTAAEISAPFVGPGGQGTPRPLAT